MGTRLGQLRVLIEEQTIQEEEMFCPSCDQTLDPKEVQEALAALQALNAPH